MNSRKVLYTLLAGAALTTVTGLLFKDATKRKEIADKLNSKVNDAKGAIKETFSDVKSQIKTMDQEADRMANEGGNVV